MGPLSVLRFLSKSRAGAARGAHGSTPPVLIDQGLCVRSWGRFRRELSVPDLGFPPTAARVFLAPRQRDCYVFRLPGTELEYWAPNTQITPCTSRPERDLRPAREIELRGSRWRDPGRPNGCAGDPAGQVWASRRSTRTSGARFEAESEY